VQDQVQDQVQERVQKNQKQNSNSKTNLPAHSKIVNCSLFIEKICPLLLHTASRPVSKEKITVTISNGAAKPLPS
jgi:hypothetical protein